MAEFEPKGIKGDYIIYRDRPLVRKGNMFCYGDMNEDYVLFLLVLTTKTSEISGEDGNEVPDHVLVQIMSTDESKPSAERLAKQFERNGLYDAIDIGLVWLEKLNKKD